MMLKNRCSVFILLQATLMVCYCAPNNNGGGWQQSNNNYNNNYGRAGPSLQEASFFSQQGQQRNANEDNNDNRGRGVNNRDDDDSQWFPYNGQRQGMMQGQVGQGNQGQQMVQNSDNNRQIQGQGQGQGQITQGQQVPSATNKGQAVQGSANIRGGQPQLPTSSSSIAGSRQVHKNFEDNDSGNTNDPGQGQGQGRSRAKKPQDDDNDYQAMKARRDQRRASSKGPGGPGRNNNNNMRNRTQDEEDRDDDDRYAKFQRNRQFIDAHNERRKKGQVLFELKINDMADMNSSEISSTRLGFRQRKRSAVSTAKTTTKRITVTKTTNTKKPTTTTRKRGQTTVKTTTLKTTTTLITTTTTPPLPTSLDWRQKGAVSPMRDQLECGGCWAFSAAGSLEGRFALKNGGKMVPLSVQNLIDCSAASYGNDGCNGGDMSGAFDYIKAEQGDSTYDAYPYIGRESGNCSFETVLTTRYAPITGYVELPDKDEQAIIRALQDGPVSGSMDAGLSSFYYYATGVYSEPMCDPQTPNHGILIIGYGVDATTSKPYWLIKNSWGEDWGENGYAKILRGTNACGIESGAIYPILA